MLRGGVYTVAPTPFDSDGTIDLESVASMATSLVHQGVEGLLVLGVMGEADRLLDSEREAVMRRFVEVVAGERSVIVGTSHSSAIGARELTQRAEAIGADAVMVSPPRLPKPNPEAVYDFFMTVSSGTSIDIVIQDHPGSSGVFLPVDLIARISSDAHGVSALKLEDPPTPPKMSAVREFLGDSISIFGGLGGVNLIEELDRGSAGTMTGFAFPEILRRIWQLHKSGGGDEARRLFFDYLPLIVFEAQPLLSLAVRKRLYRGRGWIATDYVRAPAARLDERTILELDRLVSDLELS